MGKSIRVTPLRHGTVAPVLHMEIQSFEGGARRKTAEDDVLSIRTGDTQRRAAGRETSGDPTPVRDRHSHSAVAGDGASRRSPRHSILFTGAQQPDFVIYQFLGHAWVWAHAL